MIKDFRPYYQLQEISFEISEKNITLIKAENGTGKTTLLEALKWCFYGNNLNLPNKSEFVNEKAITLCTHYLPLLLCYSWSRLWWW